MSVRFAACLTQDGTRGPDPWLESYGVSLPLGHIVAYDTKGEPASYVGDFQWDLTAYTSHREKHVLYFDYWTTTARREIDQSQVTKARVERMHELQFLMCKRLFPSDGSTLSPRGLLKVLITLRRVARFAEQHNRSVRDIFEQREWLDAFVAKLPDFECDAFSGVLSFLNKLDPAAELGFHVATPLRIKELKERAKRHRDNFKQHAPLPTRIYSQWIANLLGELEDIEAHKDRLLAALREAISLHREAKAVQTTNRISIGPELIPSHGLKDYFDKRGHDCNANGFMGIISEIFQICALQVHTFSGMRHNEGRTLPFHCMEFEKRNGRAHALFVGATTKLNGGRRMRTRWVTTDKDGFRAVRLAQEFATTIYESMGVTPSDSDAAKDSYPLFVSTDYLPWGKMPTGDVRYDRLRPHNLKAGNASSTLKSRLLPVITTEDIAELEDVDPFRAWAEEEEFAIGQPWPLTKHQLRRSLALYARASGCVRLSSLRRQLQHLTNDMSAYYGNGCAFAKNFLADDLNEFKKHICFEWQDTDEEAMVLAMVWDVLIDKEPLYGGAGNFYEQQRKNDTLMTREQVEKAIKAGTLGYNPHPLGACVKAGPCEKRMGLNFIDVACASENCKNLIGKHSKVIQVIKAKRGMLDRIDKTTLTYKAEKEELDELLKIEARWKSQNRPTAASQEEGHA